MIAVDTSVVVAAFASWHEAPAASVAALGECPRLPAHVALEAFSVLTRLPPPHRASAELVVAFLDARFPDPLLVLPEGEHRRLLHDVRSAGIAGGAVYDALVGLTARHAGATLVTRDRRAAGTYRAIGVAFELV